MNSLHIRTATRQDAEAVFALIDALATYEKQQKLDAATRARLIRDGFDEPRRFMIFLAELDGEAVGYALFFKTYSSYQARPTLYLEDLFVWPAARGRGIGKALFNACVAEAIQRGCGRMEWTVLDWNKPAIAFYQKIGARQLTGRLYYRLTSNQLETLANEDPGIAHEKHEKTRKG